MEQQMPEYITCNGFVVEVIRTPRRKSATLKVEEGLVSVVTPTSLPTERIQKLLDDKNSWINEKLKIQQKAAPPSTKDYISGEAYSYLGRNYRLKIVRGSFEPAKLKEGRLIVTMPPGVDHPHMVRNSIARWYKNKAQEKLINKVERYAPIVGVTPNSVSIKTFKSRWGSCTAKGGLEFNWKIMMAPNSIVDYVVVHELCHLIRHDHSPKYWREVERVLPDYRKRKDLLKTGALDLNL